MSTTWPQILRRLVARDDLPREDVVWAMDQVMAGQVPPARLAGLLVALRAKGETVEELTALADVMLEHAVPYAAHVGRAVDIVGTGGDMADTVNISSMAAIVTAGTGLTVVKHGNRSASSTTGSADVLEALGIDLDHSPERVARIGVEAGITFCFAKTFHPAMRHAGAVRSELGIPTAFNFLGPLTNPARPGAIAVGCADLRMAPLMAGVFATRGTHALVFRGADGLDELAANGPADVWEVRGGDVVRSTLDAVADLGLAPVTVADLRGGEARHNAAVVRRVLDGEPGLVRETVLLNAAAAIVADGSLAGTAEGSLVERLHAGLAHAAASVDSGAARESLAAWALASASA
ncbi:anthranilate phosphoribosyltransferase [Sanguibacter sp. HDW7]|uniref:anthranilate phosphoribosyltransferase n=1 Tax=Sanguibacter sp. HDW7 TaxID=2714931 RepID=UPI001407AB4F|nr:anthranilate phosphoribosyltransferase [Sanguibacter sp. HDW7]QIK83704.1 anthranilate phosphoribosyltransferase [Sanguibacter sp. HDW7]